MSFAVRTPDWRYLPRLLDPPSSAVALKMVFDPIINNLSTFTILWGYLEGRQVVTISHPVPGENHVDMLMVSLKFSVNQPELDTVTNQQFLWEQRGGTMHHLR
jgi:hypothetical protein